MSLSACADTHAEIIFTTRECPLCLMREQMDQLIDGKVDIDQENIFELFDRIKQLEHEMQQLKKTHQA